MLERSFPISHPSGAYLAPFLLSTTVFTYIDTTFTSVPHSTRHMKLVKLNGELEMEVKIGNGYMQVYMCVQI